jgi:hypothetical protein
VIRNRSGIEQRNLFKWRFGPEHLHFADVLERYPYFIVFRTYGNVGAERTALRQALDNLMRYRVDYC